MRFLLVVAGLILAAPSSFADSVNVQLFRSPFNLNYGILESAVHNSMPWEEKAFSPKYFLSADYHYVKDPLVVVNTTTNTRVSTLVNHVHTTDLALGYFFNPDLSLYVQAPLHLSSMPGESDHFDLGDSRIAAKVALSERALPLQFSLMPELTLPTGNKSRFLSDDSLGLGALLIADREFSSFRLTGNIGFRHAGGASITGINYKNRIPLGVGVAIPVAKKLLFNAEASGALAMPTSQKQNASEFYLGLNYHAWKHLAAIFGGSIGSFDRAGSVSYRVQAAVRTYFGEPEKKAAQRPRVQEERREEIAFNPPPPPPPAPVPAPKAKMVENKIEVLEEIQFEHNSDRLTRASKAVLDEVAAIIRDDMKAIKLVQVEGHTSLPGSDTYNLRLSWKRSRAVVAYLVKQRKIPAKLLVAKGYGESRPKYLPDESTAAELELNRRVEFDVVRKKDSLPRR